MFNLLKKAAKFIFSFILNLIKLFVWFSLFAFIAYLNIRFFLKGERGGMSMQNNFNR